MNITPHSDTAYYDEALLKKVIWAGRKYRKFTWEIWKSRFAEQQMEMYNKKIVFI